MNKIFRICHSSEFSNLTLSYNQPRFCPNTTWNEYGTTFSNRSIIGIRPRSIFISSSNTVYIPNKETGEIHIWENENSIIPTKTISGNLSSVYSIFVTTNGDIYADNGNNIRGIVRWIAETNTWIPVLSVNASCFGLFIDVYQNLYCSIFYQHQVIKICLHDITSTTVVVAGTGTNGYASNMLNNPNGIFADFNLDLYVADYGNNRIQLYRFGQQNGITIAGKGSSLITIELSGPSGIILDNDRHLFIVDNGNNRVIGSNEYGFYCILGCSGQGLSSRQFYYPISLSFDSYGNMYVVDEKNDRIQKFSLSKKSCILTLSYNQPRFRPKTTWDQRGTIFADSNTGGNFPIGIFVNSNNYIYMPQRMSGEILVWQNDSSGRPTKWIASNLRYPFSIFVKTNGDIYADNGQSNRRIDKWIAETGTWAVVVSVNSLCYGIFIDIYDNLYYSESNQHQVQKAQLNDITHTKMIVAGTGVSGSASNMLNWPGGIFVDINLDLYVTDSANHRVQLFPFGQQNGITIAGNSSISTTINLRDPRGVVLDGDKHVFIVDEGNKRIVRSDENGFYCIIGCSNKPQSFQPSIISFDSYGNIYVTEERSHRVQKFLKNDFIPTRSNQDCLSPTVKLITESHSSIAPLQYRHSQDFYILSMIKLNCNRSHSISKKWTIRNMTANNNSEILFDEKLITTNNDLYIPSNTLSYGVYQLKSIVLMTDYPSLFGTASVYVQINPSSIIANLLPLGTSTITVGYQQNLIFNPGNYSIDPDNSPFNASDWYYEYFCRIFQTNQSFSSIESCLFNQSNAFELSPLNSSLIIYPEAFQLNMTYQFLVQMFNRRHASILANGYAIVQIHDKSCPMIAIGCVIESLCTSNSEFKKLNPTTQVALYSFCIDPCPNVRNITWNIYYSNENLLVNQMNFYENIWFYGRNTNRFTTTKDLFGLYPNETYWKFEVVYSFETFNSISALNFEINRPPSNGSCQISPSNGTTNTLFNITCSNWYPNENIKEYSLYSTSQIIAFSPLPSFEVRLPFGKDLHLVIHIRDTLNGITEFNLSSVTVILEPMNDSFIHLLSIGNQNTIGQIITSLAEEFNQISEQITLNSFLARIPLASISISPLGNQRLFPMNITNRLPVNQTVQSEVNMQANRREYFIKFIADLTITSASSLKLQSRSLVQLTNGTNQLTRTTLVIASNKCYELTGQLHSWLNKLLFEDVQIIATQLLQSASNILTAINGPLQQRTKLLNADSLITMEFANELAEKIHEIESLLTESLSLHINIGQQYVISTPEVFMSLETIDIKSILNKTIKQMDGGQIRFPLNLISNLNLDQIISLRSMMKPMAIHGKSWLKTQTNLSRSISLSINDQNGIEMPLETDLSTPIEFFIPRDPYLEIPPMILQNVTSIYSLNRSSSFHFQYLNITNDLPISIHFEIKPLNINLSYLFVYKFDRSSVFDSSLKKVDGWILFQPENLTNDSIYTYMIDNQRTIGHQLIAFGLQEYKSNGFTANYQLRTYASGCYYLDEQNQWNSHGLLVGPLTNIHQTHCYSTHLLPL
ncbi:unnamed protein product [Adineta ricciae]|uniref:PKD/REJ-like domain-containing protein n=1 Tax=Adineta ricciae TaxID=249248 RepID=A0A815SJN7_ADIRI|nr:unnamed protein product [Adineta ricciae]CAF1494053.1 unnamed protein product [Adineta ricciae]